MWNATERTMWVWALVIGMVMICATVGLLGGALNNDSGNNADVANAQPTATSDVPVTPTINVGDETANEMIDGALNTLDTVGCVADCNNDDSLNVAEFIKCVNGCGDNGND